MAYYELQSAPTARLDGSGMVTHDIWGMDSLGQKVPSKHADFLIHSNDLEVWSAMPDSTGPERQLKNVAYKDLMVAAAPPGWTEEDLNNENAENQRSVDMAAEVDEYITVTLGQTYPVQFQLNL